MEYPLSITGAIISNSSRQTKKQDLQPASFTKG